MSNNVGLVYNSQRCVSVCVRACLCIGVCGEYVLCVCLMYVRLPVRLVYTFVLRVYDV